MMAFHEVRFPFPAGLGAVGGPVRRTEIVTLTSGHEERNTPWADSRRRWDAGPAVQSLDDMHELLTFFEARRGPLCGFRFRDPIDNKSCRPSDTPTCLDQPIGTGDGNTVRFGLLKRYGTGEENWSRRIVKPVEGSVCVAIDGVEISTVVDVEAGQVEFETAPDAGAIITAGFGFDCPVRFESEQLELSVETIRSGMAASIPLIEIRV